ncbi:serine/arginine-rich splicing factor 6-like [Camellia sinensis]|uniref:serine/arginine-rich splicing factor 6-like n=1 Tax=Camellia sinensis TaxID=4442 RepID=UPI001035A99B|nr:serine/arginine-rich splicing factor 6-like [Camellia sinensis]
MISSVKWWAKFNLPRIFEIVHEEFPSSQYAPTPAMVKAQQIPTAAISQGSQPSLPPINLGSPSSSGSKPKSKPVQSAHSKSKAKSKASPAPAQPKNQSKSKSKTKAKPISPPAQPKAKSKVKPKLSRDELLQLARQITDQAEAQSASSSDRSDQSEEGSVSSHSSEESTNQYSGPEFQDAQDPFA